MSDQPCRDCGHGNPSSALYCERCGHPLHKEQKDPLIGQTIAINTSIETVGSCPQSIKCAVGYQGTIKKK